VRTNVFVHTDPTQSIHEIATPLIGIRGGEDFVSGTAFLIGPGVAVTAYHVIEDFVRRFDPDAPEDGNFDWSFELQGFLTIDHGRRLVPLRVIRMWRVAPLDLAVLAVDFPKDLDDHVWNVPSISLLPPHPGERVTAFGFANGSVVRKEGNRSLWSMSPITSTGAVVEVHNTFRDQVRLPFPCFLTTARFDGGMSGGPIFSEAGHVCGVICSSLPPASDGEDHSSYGATLWPIVGTMIADPDGHANGGKPFPLMEVFSAGRLKATDLERVRLVRLENGDLQPQVLVGGTDWSAGRL